MTPLQALEHAPRDRSVLLDATESLAPAALRERVGRLAHYLHARRPRCVASRLDNGIEAVVIDLAARSAGVAHLPLPPFFSPAQVQGALARSGADLLCQPESAALLPGWHPQPGPLALRWCHADVAPVPLPANAACLSFTSGSTGEPRAVCLDAALLDRVAASLVEVTRALSPRRHLCALPLSTLLEQVAGIYAAMQSGAQILLPSLGEIGYTGASGLEPARLLACLDRHRPESVILLPQMLLALVSLAEAGARLPDSLRFIAVGGARVGSALLARAERLGLAVFEGYGLSECGSVVCLNRPDARCPGSVGPPLPHTQVSVGPDRELRIHGARALGYLDAPQGLPDPLPSGDLGRVDEAGFVHIDGRRKHVFITSYGRNVSPEWIETELQQHPDVAQAAVFGEARPYNVAVIVPRRLGLDANAVSRLLRSVNAGLPDYARVARAVLAAAPFSPRDDTLTANGRLRRAAIARRHAAEIDALYASEPTLEGAFVP